MARILLVTPRAPGDTRAWSGISHHLLLALTEAGSLAGAIDGHVRLTRVAELAGTFSFDEQTWQQKRTAGASPVFGASRRLTDLVVARRLQSVAKPYDAVLQAGGRLRIRDTASSALRCSYQDGNLGTLFARPDLVVDPQSSSARRAFERERRIYDDLDVIMCFSDWVRRSFIETFHQDPAKVVTVGAGANFDRLPEVPHRDFSRPRFLFIGKHFHRKGGQVLVEAFRRIRATHRAAELWVVSDHRASEPEDGVRYLGRISREEPAGDERIHELYREATGFVMPSIYEPFGVVFLEAMAYGLPCIGARSCAMPEIIEDGHTGYLVPIADIDAVEAALESLITDPLRAAMMGEAGRHGFIERFTWPAVARRITDEIDRRIDTSPTPA